MPWEEAEFYYPGGSKVKTDPNDKQFFEETGKHPYDQHGRSTTLFKQWVSDKELKKFKTKLLNTNRE